MNSTRYFTVGPVRELGDDLGRAVQQLGAGAVPPAKAHGLVRVEGRRYRRVPDGVTLEAARAHAHRTGARLGEAVALVGGQVVYRDVSGPVTKAAPIDPRTPDGFLRIVERVARALRGVARGAEAEAVRQALDRLDVDWPRLSENARGRVVAAANRALASVPTAILPAVSGRLELEADRVVRDTKGSVRRTFGLRIAADTTRTDERVAGFVAASQTNFIRDAYGRRQGAFSARARSIVSEGVVRGLGRDEISGKLRDAFAGTSASRGGAYWDVVAAAFVGRARSLAEVSSYAEAGIQYYLIEAVLDEVTTDICRFLHGKRFRVGATMAQFNRIERLRDPERIKEAQPWLRVRQDRRGRRVIVVPTTRGDVRAAIVEDSAERRGAKDEVGRFGAGWSGAKLETVDVGPPPYHGLCRTTTVPEV